MLVGLTIESQELLLTEPSFLCFSKINAADFSTSNHLTEKKSRVKQDDDDCKWTDFTDHSTVHIKASDW
jgi:hypothetical protein